MVKPIAKAMKRFIALLLVVISGCKPAPSPSADMASPSKEVRDAAARMLRANAKPPSKSKWFLLTHRIHNGETKTNVLALLRSYNLSTTPEFGEGDWNEFWTYRLDDYWLLQCEFDGGKKLGGEKLLAKWQLLPRWRSYWVPPPTNLTGVWNNYYANGQTFTEDHYQKGKRSGEFTTFEPDGWKHSVYHYDHDILNGSVTIYYPSGQIQFQGQYSNSLHVGISVRYNEDGSTNKITDLSKPRTNAVISPN